MYLTLLHFTKCSYSKTMPKSSVCGAIACAIMLVIVAISIPQVLVPFSKYDKFTHQSCYISRIDYPTTFPTFDNHENWQSCDCGRRCTSYSPCIKIYSNISDSIFLDESLFEVTTTCTFHNSTCSNGEDIRMIETYLNQSKHIYDTYINRTIDCYYDEPLTQIYMNKNINVTLLVVFGIPFGICFIIVIVTLIDYCCEKYKKNTDSDDKQFMNGEPYLEVV